MRALILVLALFQTSLFADTIEHYMNIADNIPKMQMKADAQAQAWARSAKNVLIITSESILETMNAMNQMASQQGKPLFCLPEGTTLNASQLDALIQKDAKALSSSVNKNQLTVSDLAIMAVKKAYPCANSAKTNALFQGFAQQNNRIKHVSAAE